MNERYVYTLETKIYTYRGYFDTQAPTGLELFNAMLGFHARNLINKHVFAKSTVTVNKMKIVDNIAYILFRITNPDILDNRYFSAQKDQLRDVNREGDEEPAISCHIMINLAPEYDVFRAYPTTLENVPYLSRSIVLYTLNNIFADHLKENRKWTPKSGDEVER